MANQSAFDCMYSLQNEEVDHQSSLYRLRSARNRAACLAALNLMQAEKPEVVLIPNGLVTELGAFYQAARHLDLTTITYEFNDQREQIWLARNDVVMRQDTQAMWPTTYEKPLTDPQREKIAALEAARSAASTYGKGTRQWQDTAAAGAGRVRKKLQLDARPVVLLPTNVLGDSLTLGRHIFAPSMAEWIKRTVHYFLARQDVQLVVRVHPGERLAKGTSMMAVVEGALEGGANNIHVVGPLDTVNTYDVMDLADLGLAYTTTVGLEMAMRGVPVIVAGQTHYRERGFTWDPASWEEYFSMLDSLLVKLPDNRLRGDQIESAWNYAYRFFFEYPFDFPWRLMHFWKDLEIRPLNRVLSDEGQAAFGRTFRCLAGTEVPWQVQP
jgi:hypothetical protein